MRIASWKAARLAVCVAIATLCLACTAGCAQQATSSQEPSTRTAEFEVTRDAALKTSNSVVLHREDVPLDWDAGIAYIVGSQGSTGLWGTCGECVIANTLNIVTGSRYTEADIVNFAMSRGQCEASSGGMSVVHMLAVYKELLPQDSMDARAGFYEDAPTLDEMADMLERGIILNVSVDGEMMREGGHTGEGDIYGSHWLVVHHAERNWDGSVAGFWVIDSASDTVYVDAQRFSDIYYGHDGTNILDPTCIQIFGWRLVPDEETGGWVYTSDSAE